MDFLRLFLCLAALSWSCAISAAGAQAEESETPEYTEAVKLGVEEFEQKNFIEARAHFAHAHTLYPNARTLRALGMVSFELKKYAESEQYSSQALASRERPLEGEKRERTEELLKRARTYLARITLSVRPNADLSVDGAPVRLGAAGELVLEAGDHVIELAAPGFISERRTLELKGGEQVILNIRLREIGPAAQSVASSRSDDGARRPVYKSPWLWSALGVVLVAAATGTAIALTRDRGDKSEPPYLGDSSASAISGPSKP